MNILPKPPQCWDYRCAQWLIYILLILGTELRVLPFVYYLDHALGSFDFRFFFR
jgi:hypothetical protein